MRMDFQIINLKQMIEGFLMLREGLNKTKKKFGFIHIWVGRWFRMGTKSTKKNKKTCL